MQHERVTVGSAKKPMRPLRRPHPRRKADARGASNPRRAKPGFAAQTSGHRLLLPRPDSSLGCDRQDTCFARIARPTPQRGQPPVLRGRSAVARPLWASWLLLCMLRGDPASLPHCDGTMRGGRACMWRLARPAAIVGRETCDRGAAGTQRRRRSRGCLCPIRAVRPPPAALLLCCSAACRIRSPC
jgi:hypothetical protein